jgi:DNA polymerase III psi subunit
MVDQPSTYTEELYSIKEKTTVILSTPWSGIADADRQLLQKILQSVRLNLAAVRMVHQPKLDLALMNPQPARMIYFGEPVTGLAPFECIKAEGTIVLAPPLAQLQTDPAGKQKLWIALKQLFGL